MSHKPFKHFKSTRTQNRTKPEGIRQAFEQGKKLGGATPTPFRTITRQDIICCAIRSHAPVLRPQ